MKYTYVLLCVLFIILLFSSCGRRDILKDSFTVAKIANEESDHVALQLRNKWNIFLIGIQNNLGVRQYLTKEVLNKKIKFVFDSQLPFTKRPSRAKSKNFYAYAILPDGTCLNSELLRLNLSPVIQDFHLNDSLSQFLTYTKFQENLSPNPDFDPREFLTRGCEGALEKLSLACNYRNPTTRDFAVNIAGRSPGAYHLRQVCEIFRELRSSWRYVNDPRQIDYYSPASNSITSTRLSGDCDDFAVLMYSLITAIGGEARITFAWNDQGGHAFTEVNISNESIGDVQRTIRRFFPEYDIPNLSFLNNDGKRWLNLDWWAGYPGGPYYRQIAFMQFYIVENFCVDSENN